MAFTVSSTRECFVAGHEWRGDRREMQHEAGVLIFWTIGEQDAARGRVGRAGSACSNAGTSNRGTQDKGTQKCTHIRQRPNWESTQQCSNAHQMKALRRKAIQMKVGSSDEGTSSTH
eukprot:scaffold109066_cov18-Tisochrysis_lutea.AAC.2